MKLKSEELREIMNKIDFDKLLTERYIEVNQSFKPIAMSGKFKVYFFSDYMKNNSDKEFVKINAKEKRFLIETFQRQYGLNIAEEDISIEVQDNIVNIKGTRKTATSSYTVNKSFTIPEGYSSDDIKAELINGVLSLTLKGKPLPEKEVKKIPITSPIKQLK